MSDTPLSHYTSIVAHEGISTCREREWETNNLMERGSLRKREQASVTSFIGDLQTHGKAKERNKKAGS